MGEGNGGFFENLRAVVADRLPRKPISKETSPQVSEWDGFIEVGKTRTHVVIHGEGFEVITDEQGRETVKIKEGVTPSCIGIGGGRFLSLSTF